MLDYRFYALVGGILLMVAGAITPTPINYLEFGLGLICFSPIIFGNDIK